MPVVLHAKDSHSPTASIRTEIWAIQGIWKNSSRVELECGTTPAGRRRSSSSRREVFDGPLSGQSVYEQTSGFLRHTESVRGVKIQEQDWVSDIQVLTLRTLADARSNDPARSQASVSSRAHRKLPALPPWKQSSEKKVQRRQQGPRSPQRSEGRRIVYQNCDPEGRVVGKINESLVFLPTQSCQLAQPVYSELNRARNSQGTNPRTGGHCSRKCLHKFWDFGRCSCRNFGTCIITLMLSSGPVRRDGLFWDFGSLYQKASRRQTACCCGSGK